MVTASITRRRTASDVSQRTPSSLQPATMPLEMEQALREFSLMRAFKSLPISDQRHYIWRVVEAPIGASRREQIGGLLDHLFEDISPPDW